MANNLLHFGGDVVEVNGVTKEQVGTTSDLKAQLLPPVAAQRLARCRGAAATHPPRRRSRSRPTQYDLDSTISQFRFTPSTHRGAALEILIKAMLFDRTQSPLQAAIRRRTGAPHRASLAAWRCSRPCRWAAPISRRRPTSIPRPAPRDALVLAAVQAEHGPPRHRRHHLRRRQSQLLHRRAGHRAFRRLPGVLGLAASPASPSIPTAPKSAASFSATTAPSSPTASTSPVTRTPPTISSRQPISSNITRANITGWVSPLYAISNARDLVMQTVDDSGTKPANGTTQCVDHSRRDRVYRRPTTYALGQVGTAYGKPRHRHATFSWTLTAPTPGYYTIYANIPEGPPAVTAVLYTIPQQAASPRPAGIVRPSAARLPACRRSRLRRRANQSVTSR